VALKTPPQVILQILVIVASAEIFLRPKVEKNKEIAAADFPKLQFCDAVAAIAPVDGNNGKGVAANDGFEGGLYSEAEGPRKKRAETIHEGFAVRFEGVGRVVQAVAKKCPDKKRLESIPVFVGAGHTI